MDKWWQTDPERLERCWRDADFNCRETARTLNVNVTTVTKWLDRHRIRAPRSSEPFHFDLMNELRIPLGAGIAITSDWHLPLTSYKNVDHLVQNCKRFGISRLAICGDWWNMDAWSDYAPKQADAGACRELNDSRELMRWLLDQFDIIYLTTGNHDIRALRALGWKLKFEHTVRLLFAGLADELMERIVVTGRDYVLVDTPSGVWRGAHTASYSKQSLARPTRFADRHRQNMALGHAHHHGVTTSPSGYYAVDLGGLFDEDKTEYLIRWTNDFPKWSPGYLLLGPDGKPYLPLLAPAPTQVV